MRPEGLGDVFAALADAERAGRAVVLATTVRVEGNPPSAPGNRALFDAEGTLVAGTIGCNGLDRRAGADGRALVEAGERSGMRRYTSFEGEPGEGVVEVFLEAFWRRARLLVGGRGPVADALAALGAVIGRGVQAAPPGSPEFAAAVAELGPDDGVVLVDHDDPGLVPALRQALDARAGYVGVMGSRRHTPGFVAELRRAGVDLTRLHSPTGLDIGAKAPPEIALSILAELVAVTRGRSAASLDIVRAGAARTNGPE